MSKEAYNNLLACQKRPTICQTTVYRACSGVDEQVESTLSLPRTHPFSSASKPPAFLHIICMYVYRCVCMCVCARVRVVCVCVCVCACVYKFIRTKSLYISRICMHLHTLSLSHTDTLAHPHLLFQRLHDSAEHIFSRIVFVALHLPLPASHLSEICVCVRARACVCAYVRAIKRQVELLFIFVWIQFLGFAPVVPFERDETYINEVYVYLLEYHLFCCSYCLFYLYLSICIYPSIYLSIYHICIYIQMHTHTYTYIYPYV
jgi:hypothetical protein